MKNLYVFYLLENIDKVPCNDIYAIAYTKNERDLFMMLRNMKLFHYKKFKTLEDFYEVHPEPEGNIALRMKKLYLGKLKTKTSYGMRPIDILLTWEEESSTVLWYDKVYEEMLKRPAVNPSIFKKSVFKDLKNMQYIQFWKFKEKRKPINMFGQDFYIPDKSDYDKKMTVDVDEFRVFMKLYGWTMKG